MPSEQRQKAEGRIKKILNSAFCLLPIPLLGFGRSQLQLPRNFRLRDLQLRRRHLSAIVRNSQTRLRQ
jgi:hypothetical protein